MVLESNVLHDDIKPNFNFKSYHDKIRLRNAHKCLGMLLDEKISLKQRSLQQADNDKKSESDKDNTISENEVNEDRPNENSSKSDNSKLNLEDQIIED